MISFTVSKDQNAAVLTADGCAVRLRADNGRSCRGCVLNKPHDAPGIYACEALNRQTGAYPVTFCTPAERADGRTVIWKEAP